MGDGVFRSGAAKRGFEKTLDICGGGCYNATINTRGDKGCVLFLAEQSMGSARVFSRGLIRKKVRSHTIKKYLEHDF